METSRYERKYTHYLCTRGSDSRLFNTNVRTNEDLGREISALQTSVKSKLAQMEQNASANKLLVSEQLKRFNATIDTSISSAILKMENAIETLASRDAGPGNPEKESATEKLNSRLEMTLHISDQTQPRRYTAMEDDEVDMRRKCTHNPRVREWLEVVDHWNEGCPEKNLAVCNAADR